MYLPTSTIKLLGVATFLVLETYAALNNHITNDASNFHQHNPSSNSFTRPRGDLRPVSYMQRFSVKDKRLYNKDKFNKRTEYLYNKRDYATTLKYLRAAMNSYRKDLVTPPPVELIQLEQQLPPASMVPPPAPLTIEQTPIIEQTPVIESTITPSPTTIEEVTPPPSLEIDSSSLTSSSTDTAENTDVTNVVLSNGKVESIPVSVDLEEDDYFDPEEDPDDVDAPPFINGKAISREE